MSVNLLVADAVDAYTVYSVDTLKGSITDDHQSRLARVAKLRETHTKVGQGVAKLEQQNTTDRTKLANLESKVKNARFGMCLAKDDNNCYEVRGCRMRNIWTCGKGGKHGDVLSIDAGKCEWKYFNIY